MSYLPLFSFCFRCSTLKTISLSLLILVTTLQLASCSNTESVEIWRQIPIQMARVTQTDSYTQTFILDIADNATNTELSIDARQQLDARMDQIFIKLIGARNWQYLKNLYGVSSIRDELINKRIHMEGLVNFTAYLDPINNRYVIMEGSGRFFAVRNKTGEILLSGDYHIAPQRYKIDDFESGCIPMETNIYTTRIPGKPTYYKDAIIQYDLIINNEDINNNTFSVDYRREHFAYIDLNSDNNYDASEIFASLKLKGRHHHAKLLDLSGLSFVKNNYKISDATALEAAKTANIDRQKSCVKDKSN